MLPFCVASTNFFLFREALTASNSTLLNAKLKFDKKFGVFTANAILNSSSSISPPNFPVKSVKAFKPVNSLLDKGIAHKPLAEAARVTKPLNASGVPKVIGASSILELTKDIATVDKSAEAGATRITKD